MEMIGPEVKLNMMLLITVMNVQEKPLEKQED